MQSEDYVKFEGKITVQSSSFYECLLKRNFYFEAFTLRWAHHLNANRVEHVLTKVQANDAVSRVSRL
jgi:hypothetical protein